MLVAALLGLLQGVTEWLPVSSEGVVAATYSFLRDRPLDEAIAYSLWLHLGTVISVLIAFRREIVGILADLTARPRNPTPLLIFLVASTLVSVAIGVPLLVTLSELSERSGAIAMGLIGLLMFVTGALQLRRGVVGNRSRGDVTAKDALLAGVAQGLAVLPGLSRSGLTVAVLLARRLDRREALVLSFLMSVPVSIGAGIYAGFNGDLIGSGEALVSVVVSAGVGFVAIGALLAVAQRINFARFVIVVGALIVAGAIWEALR